jgi:hypothetical protein
VQGIPQNNSLHERLVQLHRINVTITIHFQPEDFDTMSMMMKKSTLSATESWL